MKNYITVDYVLKSALPPLVVKEVFTAFITTKRNFTNFGSDQDRSDDPIWILIAHAVTRVYTSLSIYVSNQFKIKPNHDHVMSLATQCRFFTKIRCWSPRHVTLICKPNRKIFRKIQNDCEKNISARF